MDVKGCISSNNILQGESSSKVKEAQRTSQKWGYERVSNSIGLDHR